MKTPKQIRNEEPTGYRRGFIDGHKEAEKSIKEMIEKVLSILKEGCGVNFVLEEQDCICGDDFEYEDKVKVLLCELCLDKIKRIELLSKIGDVHSQQEEDELKVNETASINQNKLDVNSSADTSFLGGYAEFWDNKEDDRWDKEEITGGDGE